MIDFLEHEDRTLLSNLPELPMKTSAAWKAFSRPAEVKVDWHKTDNQGPIGSCQGNDLTSVLERIFHAMGVSVQLSRIFAYLATQKIDGLLGADNGSTISGGGKLATTIGVCEEVLTGYPPRYPGKADIQKILSAANYAAAAKYKAKSIWKVGEDPDDSLDFIGGGGGISFGISWYQGLIPKDRIVRRFAPTRSNTLGGHAMAALGYTKDGEITAVNSHADGPYIITPEAWVQMIRHPRTAMIGLAGNPTADPIDWYRNSPYFEE